MSNLTKALAVVSLLAPVTAQPLGIGEIELHSALNQNLNAEIRLSLAAGENPSDVSVKLAPPEKFDQAGVVWNYFLSKVKLEPVVQANGSIIVKVTSREALTEPFLDFLVEVTWPQGSMTREFTLLIDPPAAYNQPTVPVIEASGYSAEPIEYKERPSRKTRTAPRRALRSAPTEDITPQTPTSGEFGPVQKSDTLWSIANRLGQERNVAAQQMLTALYKANPDAFNNGDINSLKEGATLRIPETTALQKPASVRTEHKANGKQSKPEPTASATNKPLELVAPTEAKVAENAIIAGAGTPQASGTPPVTTGAVGGTDQAGDGKALELQARIEKLEQQLNMMQQLLALKDQQLASLQTNKQATVTPGESGATAPTTPAPETAAQVQPSPAPATPTPAPTPPPAPVAEVKPAPAPKPAPTPPPAPAVVEEDFLESGWFYTIAGGLGFGLLGGLGWLLWRKRQIDERTNTESMFASASQIRLPDAESSLSVPIMELGSTDDYDVGTVGESSFISDFTPSDFDAFDTDQNEVDPISEADVYLAYGRYQQAEELIRHAIAEQPNRDECKLKLLEIFYASENKEGFARFAQELADAGKQADKPFWKKITDMAKDIIPDSALFFGAGVQAPSSNGNSPAFAASAKPGLAATDEADLAFIGNDLADLDIDDELALDDNGLDFDLGSFSKSAKPQDADADAIENIDFDNFTSAQSEDERLDLAAKGLSMSDETVAYDLLKPEQENKQTTDRVELTLDGLDDLKLENIDLAETTTRDTFESFDFDFDKVAPEPSDAGSTPPEKPTDKPIELESFEFDFNSVSAEPTPSGGSQTDLDLDLDSQLKLETFDFSDFDNIAPKPTQTSTSKETAAKASGEFDFNFDFDTPIIGNEESGALDLGVSDLTDMDEFETKIDLAKAYIDMGDADAARSIAEDVLSKGSKQQQQAAQALLDELK